MWIIRYLYLKFSALETIDIIYTQKANNMNHTYMVTYKQEIGQPVPTSRHRVIRHNNTRSHTTSWEHWFPWNCEEIKHHISPSSSSFGLLVWLQQYTDDLDVGSKEGGSHSTLLQPVPAVSCYKSVFLMCRRPKRPRFTMGYPTPHIPLKVPSLPPVSAQLRGLTITTRWDSLCLPVPFPSSLWSFWSAVSPQGSACRTQTAQETLFSN